MRAIRLYTLSVLIFSLASFTMAVVLTDSVCLAGKPGGKGGGGGGTPPPAVDFTYELKWLTPPDAESASLPAINNSNVAVGYWGREGGGAIIWDPTLGIIDLNELIQSETHYFGVARGISDGGMVVGWARLHGTDIRQPFRYYYDPANLSLDFELVDFFGNGGAMRVNNAGDIAFLGNEADQVLVVPLVGEQETYPVPGVSTIWGLNSDQILVGARPNNGQDCIRLSRISPENDLVIPNAYANGLNDYGDIVGEFYGTSSDHFRYRDSDGCTVLSTAGGNPRGINTPGDICGLFWKSAGRGKSYWAPYMYNDKYGFVDAEALLPGGGDDQWISARGSNNITHDINDLGVIIGHATVNGRYAPYILVPVTMP